MFKGMFHSSATCSSPGFLAVAINAVTYDVSTEHTPVSLTGEDLPRSANSSDDARVDIAGRGFWHRCENAFFHVLVFKHYASTHRRQPMNSSFNADEREKKR